MFTSFIVVHPVEHDFRRPVPPGGHVSCHLGLLLSGEAKIQNLEHTNISWLITKLFYFCWHFRVVIELGGWAVFGSKHSRCFMVRRWSINWSVTSSQAITKQKLDICFWRFSPLLLVVESAYSSIKCATDSGQDAGKPKSWHYVNESQSHYRCRHLSLWANMLNSISSWFTSNYFL